MLAQLRRKGRDRIQDRHHHPLLARSDLPAERIEERTVALRWRAHSSRANSLSHPKSFTVCRARHSVCVLSSTVVLRTLCSANAFLDIGPTRRRRHASRRSVRDAESLVRTAGPRAGVTAESVVHAFRSAFAARENIAGANDIVLERPARAEHSTAVIRLSLQRSSTSGLRTEDGRSPSQPPQHQYSQDTRTKRHGRFQ